MAREALFVAIVKAVSFKIPLKFYLHRLEIFIFELPKFSYYKWNQNVSITISTSPPGIGLWSRSVNLTSHPRFFMLGRDRSSTHTRRDRRAHYFDVMQRYRTRRDRRCIFWQPIR